MRIDTHCHVDMFDDPIGMARAYEEAETVCVLSTMLPSHYQAALPHLKPFPAIRPALGMHPLRAMEGRDEISLFHSLSDSVEYIGEIGLDFSTDGRKTGAIQTENLRRVLPAVARGKFVTVHSRNSHSELSILLDEYSVGPVCFHYFIGGPEDAVRLSERGHYFSVNHRMLTGKHRCIIGAISRSRVLAETDGPFLTKRPLVTLRKTYSILSNAWGVPVSVVEEQLERNFQACRTRKNF
jgi:TatD DNase family protein